MAHLEMVDGKMIIRDDWNVEDIQSVADCKLERELTDKELTKVMHLLVSSFDSNTGINWSVIESAIEQVIE